MSNYDFTRGKARLFIFVVILLLGFSFRLSFIYTRGLDVDLRLLVQWARLMARGGFEAVYAQTPSAYPPLGTALLFPVGLMCPQCAVKAAPTTSELLVLRFLSIGFDMLIAAVLFRLGSKMRYAWGGLFIAGFYFLFPTMALVSGWWGQNDSWFIFFMLLAGIMLRRERPVLAWVFFALSSLIKLQAIILLPVFVAGTCKKR